MRYCYYCNQITTGKPLFCNHCGRSYNVKLCPRLHANPRSAEVCSQCGSRDLSTPQPRVPLWVPIVEFLLSLAPGLVLAAITAGVIGFIVVELVRNTQMLLPILFLGAALGVLWWVWSQLPSWLRTAIYRMLKRRREGNERRNER